MRVKALGAMISLTAFFISACPAWAQTFTPAEKRLIARWHMLNEKCRGGGGDVSEVWEACGRRNELGEMMREHRLCYGKKNEYGYQMKWHRCTKDSG